MNTGLSPDVPDTAARIPAGGQQHVYRRVKVNRLTRRQVTVIVSDYLQKKGNPRIVLVDDKLSRGWSNSLWQATFTRLK